jgi:ribose transport system substrate-binding protein
MNQVTSKNKLKESSIKKVLILMVVAVFALSSLVACGAQTPTEVSNPEPDNGEETGASQEPEEEVTIGVVVKIIDPFFQNLIDNAVARGEELGVNVIYSAASTTTAVEEQIAAVQDMISKEVDALILVPIDSKALVGVVVEAEAAGIPVISFDNKFDEQAVADAGLDPIPFVGVDNEAAAYQSAKYLVNALNGEGKVAILEGVTGADNAVLRANGAKRAFDEAGMEIVASQAADWDTEKGYSVMQNILQANPDIVGVFSSADPMSYGALNAIKDAGLEDQILIASFDGLQPAIELIAEGELLCTLDQNGSEVARRAVDVAMDAIEGKTLQEFYPVDPILITKDNAAEFLN